jgi:hypothetical protein
MSSIYNHYNENGEYTGSTVKCPGWMSPNFIGAIGSPIITILLFPLTPIITVWVIIATWAYKKRLKKLKVKRKPQPTSWNMIAWTIFMNILWVVWLFLYFIL